MVSVPANTIRSSAAAAPPQDATKHESHLEGAPRHSLDATRDATDAICHSADAPRLPSHPPRKIDDAPRPSIDATREATVHVPYPPRPRGPRPVAIRHPSHSPASPRPAATKPPTITKPLTATKPPATSARHPLSSTSQPADPDPVITAFLRRAHFDDVYYDAQWHTNTPRAAARPLLRVPSPLGFQGTNAELEYSIAVLEKKDLLRRRPNFRSKTQKTQALVGIRGQTWFEVEKGDEEAVKRCKLKGGVEPEPKANPGKLPSKYQPELAKQSADRARQSPPPAKPSTDHTKHASDLSKQSPAKPSGTPKVLAKPGPLPKTHTPKQSPVEDIGEYEALLKGRDMTAAAGMGGRAEDGAVQEHASAAAQEHAPAAAQEHAPAAAHDKVTPAGRENVAVAQAPGSVAEERASTELSAPVRAFGRDRANVPAVAGLDLPAAGTANDSDGQPSSAASGSQSSSSGTGSQSPAHPPQSVEDAFMQEMRAWKTQRMRYVLEDRRRQLMLSKRPNLVQPFELGRYTHPQHIIIEPPLQSTAPRKREVGPSLRMVILSLLVKEKPVVTDDEDDHMDAHDEEDGDDFDEGVDTEEEDDMQWANEMTDEEAAQVDWDAVLAQKEREAWAKKRKAFLDAYDPKPPAKVDLAERVRLLKLLGNPLTELAVNRHNYAMNKRCAMYIDDAKRAYYARGTPRKATVYSFLVHRSPFYVYPPTLRWPAEHIFAWFAARPTHDDVDIIRAFAAYVVGRGKRVQAEVWLDVFRHVRKCYGGGGPKDGFAGPDFLDEFRWELEGEDGPDGETFEDLLVAAFEGRGAGYGLMCGDIEKYTFANEQKDTVVGEDDLDDDDDNDNDDDDDDWDEDGDVKMYPFDARIKTPGARREVVH